MVKNVLKSGQEVETLEGITLAASDFPGVYAVLRETLERMMKEDDDDKKSYPVQPSRMAT